jgi:DNA repair exonuclease SbcCD ATPase subunit
LREEIKALAEQLEEEKASQRERIERLQGEVTQATSAAEEQLALVTAAKEKELLEKDDALMKLEEYIQKLIEARDTKVAAAEEKEQAAVARLRELERELIRRDEEFDNDVQSTLKAFEAAHVAQSTSEIEDSKLVIKTLLHEAAAYKRKIHELEGVEGDANAKAIDLEIALRDSLHAAASANQKYERELAKLKDDAQKGQTLERKVAELEFAIREQKKFVARVDARLETKEQLLKEVEKERDALRMKLYGTVAPPAATDEKPNIGGVPIEELEKIDTSNVRWQGQNKTAAEMIEEEDPNFPRFK